jgi:hypothetical protein
MDEDEGKNETAGRDELVAGWPRLAGGGTRTMVMLSSDGCEAWYRRHLAKGLPFMAVAGLQRSSKLADVSGGGNTGLNHGQAVRSRWRERDCGRRWQSSVTASYSSGTEKDGVQRSVE